MADLPIELWHSIFGRLQLTDLSSCAQVSKAFHFAVREYRIREIAFTSRIHEWFHHASDNYRHRVYFKNVLILKGSSFNLEHLKRLKIGRLSPIDDLNEINKFAQLEELDIDLKNYKNEKSRTLSLANLKVLYVLVLDNEYPRPCFPYVELDTPRLAKVYTFSLRRLEFIYPESVRCIHTFFHSRKLSMFRNLEYLHFTDRYNLLDYWDWATTYDSKSFKEFSMTVLKKLKEIHFHYTYLGGRRQESGYIAKNMSDFKKVTANLLALKRPELKLFWQNVQMIDTDLLTEHEHMIKSDFGWIAFQLQHYEKLTDKVDFFWRFNFTWTMRYLEFGFDPRSEEFLSKFFAKISLRKITVHYGLEKKERRRGEDLLLEFIARSPNLLSLEFEKSDLGQEFFDRMAEIIQLHRISLRLFKFIGSPGYRDKLRNFEFVCRFQDLQQFVTDQQLPAELIAKLLKLPELSDIEFSTGRGRDELYSREFRIERMSVSRYRLNEKPLSLQELLEQSGIARN